MATVTVAVALAVEVARLSAAEALAETRTERAALIGSHVPAVLASGAMAEVGRAAAHGQLPSALARDQLHQLSAAAPLDPEPYLVAAAVAQKEEDLGRAEALLLHARALDPRSAAARYLLADVWLRTGRIADGLGEMAILTRLLRGTSVELVPALADYARTPGAAQRLQSVLQKNPPLRSPLLTALAADPANTQLVLNLESATADIDNGRPKTWRARLLQGLIERGEYDEAYRLWRRFAGVTGPRPLLFNGDFEMLSAPTPFNWQFWSTGAGLAEPGNGSVRVLYYGRDNVRLASQMLLLPAGRYRFSSVISGRAAPGSLAWTIRCAGGPQVMQLDLSMGSSAAFTVPSANCPAQTLTLNGLGQEMAQESELRIGPAKIERLAQ